MNKKFTIFVKNPLVYEVDRITKEAEAAGLSCNVMSKLSTDDLENMDNLVGSVVLWRSLLNSDPCSKAVVWEKMQNRKIINNIWKDRYFVTHKSYQQEVVKQNFAQYAIPTYVYRNKKEILEAVDKGILQFPFIQKPNKGAQGNGISLIKGRGDIDTHITDTQDFIYQNFIKNTGDFRVLMLGGVVLGVMKRKAVPGGFLNNASQGGSVEEITGDLKKEISLIAVQVSAVFGLDFCGVDIIYDEIQKEYKFLEINTVPQFEHFELATGINVAQKIVTYASGFIDRQSLEKHILIDKTYSNLTFIKPHKKFHYFSRMYLWTHKDVYRKELDKLKDFYVGTDAKETVLSRFDNSLLQVSKWGKMRNPFFKKYPLLMPANSMFFFELFTRKIYGVETKDTIKARLPKSQVLDIIKEISKDYDALSVLSTHAINFMYGAERIYGDDEPLFDPSVFVDVMQNKMQKLENKEHVAMVIYLVTHCIIGASEFYSEEITRDIEIYKTLFREGEKVIQEHYADVALDAKFEFLVCARLLNQETFLEKIIYTEAENSLSPIHNFMDDTLNTNVDIKKRYPELREHTNVLYIMSRSKRNQKDIFNI